MKKSLPIRRPDGSVIIEPLRPQSLTFEEIAALSFRERRRAADERLRVQPLKILRDIAILILLAITILAGSAVLIATIWHDVVIAENEVRIVEAEQAAIAKLAEAEMALTAKDEARHETFVFILAALGIAIIILALTRAR